MRLLLRKFLRRRKCRAVKTGCDQDASANRGNIEEIATGDGTAAGFFRVGHGKYSIVDPQIEECASQRDSKISRFS